MKRYNKNQIKELNELLKNNGVISVPTDTVYGICCSIKHRKAQTKLKVIKGRPASKPFPIMCADIEQIKSIAIVDNKSKKIIKEFMPGPITIVLRKNEKLPEYINNGKETIAIRMATSKELKELIKSLGCPVFMTSANKSGKKVCKTLEEIEKNCPDLDGILEGTVSFGQASTIVDCTSKKIKILREGPISKDEIMKVLNNL